MMITILEAKSTGFEFSLTLVWLISFKAFALSKFGEQDRKSHFQFNFRKRLKAFRKLRGNFKSHQEIQFFSEAELIYFSYLYKLLSEN